MAKLINIQLDNETNIYMETTDILPANCDPMLEEASAGEMVINKTKDYLDKIIFQIKTFSSSISDPIRNISDEAEIEFSIKIAADAGIIISSINTESSITVKLKWKNRL